MVKSSEYIISSLKGLVTVIPSIKVRYEHHEPSKTHFIEIRPAYILDKNDKYQSLEVEIVSKFIDNFPTENICFISNEDKVGISKVDFETQGKEYGQPAIKSITTVPLMMGGIAVNKHLLSDISISSFYTQELTQIDFSLLVAKNISIPDSTFQNFFYKQLRYQSLEFDFYNNIEGIVLDLPAENDNLKTAA